MVSILVGPLLNYSNMFVDMFFFPNTENFNCSDLSIKEKFFADSFTHPLRVPMMTSEEYFEGK